MNEERECNRASEEAPADCREEWAAIAADWLSQVFPRSAKLPADDRLQQREAARPAQPQHRH